MQILGLSEEEACGRTLSRHDWNPIREGGSSWPGDEHPYMITLRIGQALNGQVRNITGPDRPMPWISTNTGPTIHPGKESPKDVGISFNDINNYELIEEELRQSYARHRAIFQTNQAPKLLIDPSDGAIVDANQAACRFYGYSHSEIRTKRITDINTLSPKAVKEEMRRAKQKDRLVFQFRHRLKSGEVRDVEVYSGPVHDQGRTLLHSIVIDVTGRKLAEEEINAKNATLEAVFASAPYVMLLVDEEGRVVDINHAGETMVGRSKEDLLGLLGGQVFRCINSFGREGCGRAPECAQCPVRTRVEHTFATRRPIFSEEGRMEVMVEGQTVRLDLLISTSLINSNGAEKALVSILDISERKQAEMALRESEERNRQILYTAMDGFWRVDAQTRLVDVNEAYCRMSGYSQEELLSMSVRDLEDQEASEDVASRARRIMAKGSDRFTSRHRRKDGSLIVVEVSIQYRPGEGGGEFAVFLRDVTEQRRMEAQLRQAQKMEALGTLAGGIAHDFNNILGAVLGYSEIAYDDAVAGHCNPADINEIMKAAQRAKELVHQILTFSRKNEPTLQLLSLNKACIKAQKILERTIPKMIAIECDLDERVPYVSADPTQVEQVLLNLCSNAADAMPDGGRLVLATSALSPDEGFRRLHPEVPSGDYVMLTVSDTGCGMDRETHDRIFEPFYTTKEVGKGTGLGLSTVYGIVKTHGGFIYCDSEPGRGTSFNICLPVKSQEQSKSQIETFVDAKDAPGGTETILLVDDEDALRTVAARILRGGGYSVLEASSGEEALKVFSEQPSPPNLIITDLGMPGMGGHKAMLELFALHPGIKVVIASGYAAQARVKVSLEAGAAGYVAKPFKRVDLLATVRNVLDKN